jgi:amidase
MTTELTRLTATEAVALLRRREVSPLDLIEAAAARIAEVEPAVNALPTLCLDRARDHAKRLMQGEGREHQDAAGWLGGLPVSIKDLTDVAGVRTTYGSPIFKDHVPQASHPVVKRIEARGGIVIGKSNTPELGLTPFTESEALGPARIPWNLDRTPGGSSGGSGAAHCRNHRAVFRQHGSCRLCGRTERHGGAARVAGASCRAR